MYNAEKIIPGILIFIGLILSPFAYNLATGQGSYKPQLVIDRTKYKNCIESREYMIANHMTMLIQWRDSVVRTGKRIYTASDGTPYNMSLTNTCLKCHDNKAEFCDRCHGYASVSPVCWDCHLAPEVKK